jgi:MGT family glycosyltransferase
LTNTVLFITPDYVSHFNPLIPVGLTFAKAGYTVVVATGQALRHRVESIGFHHVELRLGEESNDGLIDSDRRVQIHQSLDATRRGWYAALAEQANGRMEAFLWRREVVAERTLAIVEQYSPACVIAVQLTYAATAALIARDVPFVTFVTGHPSQFPASGEIYGFPYSMPAALRPQRSESHRLLQLCEAIQRDFTTAFNALLRRINPQAALIPNGLAAASPRLAIFNYPPALIPRRLHDLPQRIAYIGASVRDEKPEPDLEHWLKRTRPDLPTVFFAFGSYFSVHTDILRRIADALREEPVRVLFASGLSEVEALGPLPAHWLVREYLPQVALLRHCDLAVCHGGNNTVTEAFAAGVPVVVAPFASDQFGSAASVEEHFLGSVFDPNHATVDAIRSAIRSGIAARSRVAALGVQVRALNGPALAFRLCEEALGLS